MSYKKEKRFIKQIKTFTYTNVCIANFFVENRYRANDCLTLFKSQHWSTLFSHFSERNIVPNDNKYCKIWRFRISVKSLTFSRSHGVTVQVLHLQNERTKSVLKVPIWISDYVCLFRSFFFLSWWLNSYEQLYFHEKYNLFSNWLWCFKTITLNKLNLNLNLEEKSLNRNIVNINAK